MKPEDVVNLTDEEKTLLVHKKATCPFIGAAVSEGHLKVRNTANNPLASIKDVKELGDSGGGHLGVVLELFANGNHAVMRDASGQLNELVPDGLFSLEFPGSQGSHAGHSGILQGHPMVLDSGRLDEENFERLVSKAQNGLIKRSDVGRFIAENVLGDKNSKVRGGDDALQSRALLELLQDITLLVFNLGDAEHHREVQQRVTKTLAEDNLAGSAGEFGLLFAFLANKPGAQELDDEPALAVDDLKLMFVDKRLPDGWETWEKSAFDWLKHTVALEKSAREAYRQLKPAD